MHIFIAIFRALFPSITEREKRKNAKSKIRDRLKASHGGYTAVFPKAFRERLCARQIFLAYVLRWLVRALTLVPLWNIIELLLKGRLGFGRLIWDAFIILLLWGVSNIYESGFTDAAIEADVLARERENAIRAFEASQSNPPLPAPATPAPPTPPATPTPPRRNIPNPF